MWNTPLADDDYDYDSIRDADYDDYDEAIWRFQSSLWEPYESEVDDGGNYFTLLRRPKWLGRYSDRVRASERGWCADLMDEEAMKARLDGHHEAADALERVANRLRAEDEVKP